MIVVSDSYPTVCCDHMQSGSRAHSTFKFSPPEAQVALVVVIPPIQQYVTLCL